MLHIYILELESNKYYVGRTTNPKFSLKTYLDSNDCEWTIKYKPVKLIELINGCDNFDEDKYTLKYMSKYGINDVRRGSFREIKLSEENIKTINKMILNSSSNSSSSSDSNNKDSNNNFFNYDKYIAKFNSYQTINFELIELEKYFEYVKILNEICNRVNQNWKFHIILLNNLSNKIINVNFERNKIPVIYSFISYNKSNEIINIEDRVFSDPQIENNINELYNNLLFIVDNINIDDKFSSNTFSDINSMTDIQLNFFFNTFFNSNFNITGLLNIVKLKFSDCINNNTKIDLDIDNSLKKWN